MNELEDLVERLRTIAYERAGGTSSEATYDPELLCVMTEAADKLEELAALRIGWACYAGGEKFTTHDRSVAEEWSRDGFDVERFIL